MWNKTGIRVALVVDGKISRSKRYLGRIVSGNALKSLVEFDGSHGEQEWIDDKRLHIFPGRPPAAGTSRQVVISVTIPPEYRAWLDERGDRSGQIRVMIEREMSK